MNKNVLTSFTILCLLSTVFLIALAFNVQPAKASETIHIRADGSIEGTDKIQRDGDIYTFTDNINGSIVVEKSNIVVDGAGYTLQGTEGILYVGITLSERSDVTIKSMEITTFSSGIWVEDSHNIRISGNNITNNNRDGIHILSCSDCSIFGNNITDNNERGIWLALHASSNNKIYGNNIANSKHGIFFSLSCEDNAIYENNITNNQYGIYLDGILISGYRECPDNNTIYGNNLVNNTDAGVLLDGCLNNIFYHNNFINNAPQIKVTEMERQQTNIWDNGYPLGGNYWSDYTGIDKNGDDAGDTPYVIDEANKDNYPLMSPWSPTWSPKTPVEVPFWMQWWLWAIVAVAIVTLSGAVYFLKKRKPPTPTTPPEGTV